MGEQYQLPTAPISQYHTRVIVRFTQSNLRKRIPTDHSRSSFCIVHMSITEVLARRLIRTYFGCQKPQHLIAIKGSIYMGCKHSSICSSDYSGVQQLLPLVVPHLYSCLDMLITECHPWSCLWRCTGPTVRIKRESRLFCLVLDMLEICGLQVALIKHSSHFYMTIGFRTDIFGDDNWSNRETLREIQSVCSLHVESAFGSNSAQ